MADISKLFEKAKEAAKRRSYDMAVELYQQILAIQPDSEKARLELRETEVKKVNEVGPPSKFMTVFSSIPFLIKGAMYRLVKKTDLTAIEYEKILALDPRNALISFRLGKTLEICGHSRSALAVYRGIALWDPSNVAAFLAAGAAARRLNRIEEALAYFTTARNLNPKEKTASDAVRDLSAIISLKPREEASSFRDLIKKPGAGAAARKEGADKKPEGAGAPGEGVRALKARVVEDPTDPEAVLALADALEKQGDFKGLIGLLKKAVKEMPSEKGVLLRFREANVSVLEAKIRQLEAKGKEGGAPPEEIETFREKWKSARIVLLKSQLEFEPMRQDLRFDLGVLHFEGSDFDAAIACFQQVKRDPKKSRDAAFWLGRGFLEKGKYNLAVNQLDAALVSGGILDVRAKETLYFLGKAKTAAGDLEGARKHFEKIYEEDINFRDVDGILEEMG